MKISAEVADIIRTVPDFPKPGIQFKDITPLLESPDLCRRLIKEFHRMFSDVTVDAIAGVESRGFLFGLALAMEMDVPFITIRKKGKLPAQTVSYKYDLEYASAEVEMHQGSVKPGMNVLVHDDLLATGGTAAAAAELIRMEGGVVPGFAFLIELKGLGGKEFLAKQDVPVKTILSL